MNRPNVDAYFLAMAALVATRSTCVRRSVGCVLVDVNNRVLATGYNGVPSGWAHCLDRPCAAATAPPGVNLDGCAAIHAEQNAVMMCSDPSRIKTAYCTTRPCPACAKLLINTGCQRVVYLSDYEDPVGILEAEFETERPDHQEPFATLLQAANLTKETTRR